MPVRARVLFTAIARAGASVAAGITLLGAAAEKSRPPETTPESLPGAEARIFRDLEPAALRVHIFKPAGWQPTDHRAAFVWFFGGGWTRGTPANAAGWARWAAQHGLVGPAPDYRTHDRFGTAPLASVADSRAALHWIEAHAAELGVDPRRIVVGGNSSCGHVALWTAIARAPPGSSADESPAIKPAALILTSAVSDTTTEKGYTPARFGADALALSPVDQLDAKMPPMLVFHGDADTTVPQAQSLALRDRLRATGNVCEFVSVPGGSHNFAGDLPEWRAKAQSLAVIFLRQQGLLP
jgi:acetyl esterase